MEDLGGQKVNRILVPLSAQDFTPFAQQIKQQRTDLLFVAWAGTTAPAMWRALDQQNVFALGRQGRDRSRPSGPSWSTFGPAANRISFLSHYVSNAPKNKVNDFLVNAMRKRGQVPDIFTPDGFVAGQMIVRALTKGSVDDVDKMISALEGWSFTGPEGPADDPRLRPRDAAADVPGQARRVGRQVHDDGDRSALRAKYTAPPEKK